MQARLEKRYKFFFLCKKSFLLEEKNIKSDLEVHNCYKYSNFPRFFPMYFLQEKAQEIQIIVNIMHLQVVLIFLKVMRVWIKIIEFREWLATKKDVSVCRDQKRFHSPKNPARPLDSNPSFQIRLLMTSFSRTLRSRVDMFIRAGSKAVTRIDKRL